MEEHIRDASDQRYTRRKVFIIVVKLYICKRIHRDTLLTIDNGLSLKIKTSNGFADNNNNIRNGKR